MVYTTSAVLPKDAVIVGLFYQADAVDTAQVHLPKVFLLEGLQIQTGCGKQPLDIPGNQKHVSGGTAATVGAAHAGEAQSPVIERGGSFPAFRSRCSVDWSLEGKDRSLLKIRRSKCRKHRKVRKKTFSALVERRLYGERRIRTFEG
jgi:hypothetical protein